MNSSFQESSFRKPARCALSAGREAGKLRVSLGVSWDGSNKDVHGQAGRIERKWWLVDATDKVVGRVASDIAMILMGKHRPTYTPHVDTGDFVVVINVEKIIFSDPNKWEQKQYTWYTGYPGLRAETAAKRKTRRPELILSRGRAADVAQEQARLQDVTKLKLYAGSQHPHQAQQPEAIDLGIKKQRSPKQ